MIDQPETQECDEQGTAEQYGDAKCHGPARLVSNQLRLLDALLVELLDQVGHLLTGRSVDPLNRFIANGRIGIRREELVTTGAIGLSQLLVFGDECLHLADECGILMCRGLFS